ncbi:MAG: hypothetical protein QM523_03520 [Candidatus Pacebacteria bacterium]|nr:hypothetical protein [Candidatus Paceibacterota bacterium]
MTKKLMVTVAFSGLMTAGVANAADAPLAVKINGFFDAYIQTAQETYPKDLKVTGNNAASTAMVGRLRLIVNPVATKSGITYGAQLRINTGDGTLSYDRAFGYVSTASLGKLSLGRAGYLGYANSIGTVYANNGSLGGLGPNQNIMQRSLTAGGGTGAGLSGGVVRADKIAGSYIDATPGNGFNRINYETPTIAGATAGISYTPRASFTAATDKNKYDWSNPRAIVGKGYKDVVEVAAKYNINMSGLDMTLAGAYVAGTAADATGSTGFDRNLRNLRSFGASYTLKYAGVVANIAAANAGTSYALTDGGYFAANKAAAVAPTVPRTIGFVVNLGYESGKAAGDYSVGGYYGKGQSAGAKASMTDPSRYTTAKVTQYGIGAQIVVIPGLVVFLTGDRYSVFSDNAKAGTANVDTSAGGWTDRVTAVTLGSTISF